MFTLTHKTGAGTEQEAVPSLFCVLGLTAALVSEINKML